MLPTLLLSVAPVRSATRIAFQKRSMIVRIERTYFPPRQQKGQIMLSRMKMLSRMRMLSMTMWFLRL